MIHLTSSKYRSLLSRAVAILDDADRAAEDDWFDVKNDFLIDLAAEMGVAGTQGIVEALTPKRKRKYQNHKAERAARNVKIIEAYQQPFATMRGVGEDFGLTGARICRIVRAAPDKRQDGAEQRA